MKRLLTLIVLLFFWGQVGAQNGSTEFILAEGQEIQLFKFDEISDHPCFQLNLNMMENGAPKALSSYSNSEFQTEFKAGIEVYEQDQLITPSDIHLEVIGKDINHRYVMILFDVSGSMYYQSRKTIPSKFSQAKEACETFIDEYVNEKDLIAIVPFGSRQVAENIEKVQFTNDTESLRKIVGEFSDYKASYNNTALYSATLAALSRMQKERQVVEEIQNVETQWFLYVMTDGKNDVYSSYKPGLPPDDENLLRDNSDWQKVQAFADSAQIQVMTIGFGEEKNLDHEVLKKLAWPDEKRYLYAKDKEALERAFKIGRLFQLEQFKLTFLSTAKRFNELNTARTIRIKHPETGANNQFVWSGSNGLGKPSAVGVVGDAVKKALSPPTEGLSSFRSNVITFIVFALALLIAWRAIPKWCWGDEITMDVLRERAMNIYKSK